MSEEKYNINDLTIKLQVLSKGVIDERQKTQSYINRIKEYEEIISKKDNDIVKLNKEKYDLQTNLLSETESLPKSQTETAIHDVVNHLFKINENEYEEFERVQEKNNQLKAQRKELTQKLVDTHEMFDQQRMKFDTLITIQETQVTKAQKTLENLQIEINSLKKLIERQTDQIKHFDDEKIAYENKYSEIEDQIKQIETKQKQIENESEELTKIQLNPKLEKIKEMQHLISARLEDIKEQKQNQIAIEPEEFFVVKEDSFVKKYKVKVIFRQNVTSLHFEIVIEYQEKEGNKIKENEELYFLNVKEFKKFDKKKFKFEYRLPDSEQAKTYLFEMDVLLVDYFYEKFSDFYNTAQDQLQ